MLRALNRSVNNQFSVVARGARDYASAIRSAADHAQHMNSATNNFPKLIGDVGAAMTLPALAANPDNLQLTDVICYWIAENVADYQTQWKIKLARYVEKGRKQTPTKRSREGRDCTMVADMD